MHRQCLASIIFLIKLKYKSKGFDDLSKINNLKGYTFGRLKVRERAEDQVSTSGRHRIRWICDCECGAQVTVLTDNLKRGKTVSCGCYRAEKNKEKFGIHFDTQNKLYGVWCGIKSRCYNQNSTHYSRYGGRGIRMCDEWKDDYCTFRDWAINNGYHEGLSIDRVDNNQGYYPSNCQWVDSVAQANNRSSNKLFTINGETHNLSEWAKLKNINYKTLYHRVFTAGWDFEKAISN